VDECKPLGAGGLGLAGAGANDFITKVLHMAWHPQEHVLACAASNSLYIFNA
jgi:serine/threonine-protein phosphatase 2A regulatory subunit B